MSICVCELCLSNVHNLSSEWVCNRDVGGHPKGRPHEGRVRQNADKSGQGEGRFQGMWTSATYESTATIKHCHFGTAYLCHVLTYLVLECGSLRSSESLSVAGGTKQQWRATISGCGAQQIHCRSPWHVNSTMSNRERRSMTTLPACSFKANNVVENHWPWVPAGFFARGCKPRRWCE